MWWSCILVTESCGRMWSRPLRVACACNSDEYDVIILLYMLLYGYLKWSVSPRTDLFIPACRTPSCYLCSLCISLNARMPRLLLELFVLRPGSMLIALRWSSTWSDLAWRGMMYPDNPPRRELIRPWCKGRTLVQVTIYRRIRIGRDGHRPTRSLRNIVTCTRVRAQMLLC